MTTEWVRSEKNGLNTRGWTLMHRRSGFKLGQVEPYRGGGVMQMIDGEMHYPKGWWMSIEGIPSYTACKDTGYILRKYNQRVKTREEARRIIKSFKGVDNVY
jgi:hypothetical protein